MKTKEDILRNLHNVNIDEVENYVDRLTRCLFEKHVTSWNVSINGGLTDYNKMLAQHIVSRLQSMGFYAKYDTKSSPWRYFVTISVNPFKEQSNDRCIFCLPFCSLFKLFRL